jgi:predicted GIY-YIG superfamily endonuclease
MSISLNNKSTFDTQSNINALTENPTFQSELHIKIEKKPKGELLSQNPILYTTLPNIMNWHQTTTIYVLRLEDRYFYVGKTNDVNQRYAQHCSGNGCEWTKLHKPVCIERIIENASPYDEDKITKEYMDLYGIDQVRGGSYVAINLSPHDIKTLNREKWMANDWCMRCGQAYHFVKDCDAVVDINGNKLFYQDNHYNSFNNRSNYEDILKRKKFVDIEEINHYETIISYDNNLKSFVDSDVSTETELLQEFTVYEAESLPETTTVSDQSSNGSHLTIMFPTLPIKSEKAIIEQLRAFLNAHLILAPGNILPKSSIESAYRTYCKRFNLVYPYNLIEPKGLSRDLRIIDERLKPERKGANRELSVLDFQLVGIKESQNRSFNPKKKKIYNLYIDIRNWYNNLQYRKLFGSHIVESTRSMPSIQSLILDMITFILFYKAPCGLGKTELIKIYLDLMPANASVLCICGRILLSQKQVEDFKSIGMESYQHHNGIIKNVHRLAVTIDSLYWVRGRYDYIILDEVSYTLNQLVIFSKEKERNVNALIERIYATPRIIVADAYLANTTINIFRLLRHNNEIIIYENNFPIHSDKTVFVYTKETIWFDALYRDIKEGKKLIICCGVKDKVAKLLERELSKLCRTICYTSDSVILGDPTTEWDQYDAVIFTSVIEAGNCFTKLHFDKVYGNFTTQSFGPESAAQMVFRARQTHTGHINLVVKQANWNNRIPDNIKTYEQAREYFINLSKDSENNIFDFLTVSVLENDINSNHPYIDIYTDVKFRENMGKRYYLHHVLKLLKYNGVQWGEYIDEPRYQEILKISTTEFKSLMVEIKNSLKDSRCRY